MRDESSISLILDWILLHYWKLITKNAEVFKQRLASKPEIVEILLNAHNPDIITLSEVMPYLDSTLETLERYGYKYIVGEGKHVAQPLTNAVVIASKSELRELPFDMPGNAGAGSVGAYIPDIDTLVFSAHPSAFNRPVRIKQLTELAKQISTYLSEYPESNVIFAGDLNTESVESHFQHLSMEHYAEPTFPSDRIFNALRSWYLLPIRYLGRNRRQRALDHVFIRSDGQASFDIVETTSDHKAIVMELEFDGITTD